MTCANFQSFRSPFTIPTEPFHYTKEILKNTKENFESQYFDILSFQTYSKFVVWHWSAFKLSSSLFEFFFYQMVLTIIFLYDFFLPYVCSIDNTFEFLICIFAMIFDLIKNLVLDILY